MAKSAAVGPLMCASPPDLGAHMLGSTMNANLNSLDSIATAAVKLLSSKAASVSDKEERLRERRSQIAAASRKSRAKRKREHSVLKEENELLLLEVSALRKRLKGYVRSDASEDGNEFVKPEKDLADVNLSMAHDRLNISSGANVNVPLKKKLVSRYSNDALKVEEAKLTREAKSEAQKEIFERVKSVISPDLRARLTAEPEVETNDQQQQSRGYSSLEDTLSDARDALEPAMSETPVLGEILGFFHKQLEEYFAFLKSDVVGHFGSNFTKNKQEALLDLRLRFVYP